MTIPIFRPCLPYTEEDTMPYTGTDVDLIDLQNQITTNLTAANKSLASLTTQIKQVTLTLESELQGVLNQFNTLKQYIESNLPS